MTEASRPLSHPLVMIEAVKLARIGVVRTEATTALTAALEEGRHHRPTLVSR